MSDNNSSEINLALADYYIQFRTDGTGEGGFWHSFLTKSHFFECAKNKGTIIFTPNFDLFGQTDYLYVKTETSDYIVSRVDFKISTIIGD